MIKYEVKGEICEVTVTTKKLGAHVFVVDAEDVPRLRAFNWTLFKARERIYCSASIRRSGAILLHRLVTSFEWDMVDHVNNDSKDNRKINLRQATHSENMRNTGAQKNNKLGIKGVRWRERHKRYEASIWHKKSIFIGLFKTKEEAAMAYNEAAKAYFGEFAKLNEVAA